MAIGINWAAIWNEAIWATPPIWSQDAAPPEPEPEATQKAAGRRRKRRYFVEIDGQEFDVESVEEAQALLSQARSLAEQVVTRERNSIIVKPGLRVPQIRTPNKELVPAVQKARAEIRDLYAELKRDLEIRYLLAKADEDEEEAIIRLLI